MERYDPEIDQCLSSVCAHITQLEAEIAMLLRRVDDSVAPIKLLFDSYEPRSVLARELY